MCEDVAARYAAADAAGVRMLLRVYGVQILGPLSSNIDHGVNSMILKTKGQTHLPVEPAWERDRAAEAAVYHAV